MRPSIVIPVYNECATITAVLRTVASAKLPPGEKRDLVVYGSRFLTGAKRINWALRILSQVRMQEWQETGGGAGVCRGAENHRADGTLLEELTTARVAVGHDPTG
jgi:hypothetical protein